MNFYAVNLIRNMAAKSDKDQKSSAPKTATKNVAPKASSKSKKQLEEDDDDFEDDEDDE